MNQLVDKNSLAKFMTLLKENLVGLSDRFEQSISETREEFQGWLQKSGLLPSGGSVAGFFSEGTLDTKVSFHSLGSPSKKDLLRMWVPVLMDTTKNTNKTTPAKRLRRNNLLRFEDGSFAPVVGITQAMYEQCMNHDIYTLDIESGEYTRIYPLGEYDAVAQWEADRARIKAGKPIQELFMENEAGGYTPVTHILRPWETTETKYTLGMANITTLYLLDQQKVPLNNLGVGDGQLWKGIFVNADSFFEGVDFSKWKLPPTAIGMCPITTIQQGDGDKARNFFYLYQGEGNCRSNPGLLPNNPTYEANRTYPRVKDVDQPNNAKYARANNADVMASYPFAEGGYFAHNVFITAIELAMGDRHLANAFSNNSYMPDKTTFFLRGGIRLKVAGTETWEYRAWNSDSDPIRWDQSGNSSSMLKGLKNLYPIEQCLESQLAASMATELDIQPTEDGKEPHYFEFYGNKYYYKTVSPDLDSLKEGGMNVQVLKYTHATISAWAAGSVPTDFDVEIIQNTPLYNGVNLSGDIWAYYGGGLEMVGTPKAGATLGSVGNQIDLYVEPDQTKWLFETDTHKPAGQRFNFEDTYQLLATVNDLKGSYTLTRESYTPWKIAPASSLLQGESYYHWSSALWISGTDRVRLRALFRGSALASNAYPRAINSQFSANYEGSDTSGSMQALVEIE